MLIDIYNDDSRVRLGSSARLKPQVQAVEFQPRDEVENRHGPLAHERRHINGKRRNGDDAANNERGFVAPPFLQKSGAFNLTTFRGQGHELCGVAEKQKSRKANKRVPVIQVSIASTFIRRPAISRRPSPVAIGPLCSFPCFRYTVARALVSGIAMSGKKQIWYLEGSVAEKLAAPLRPRYDLRPVSQNKKGALHSAAAAGNGVPT